MDRPGFEYVGISTSFYCHDGNNNFVFNKRSQNARDEQGRWDPGAGQLDFGLEIEKNVLRELREEYGCSGVIEGGIPPHSILRELDGVPTHWIAIPFFVRVNREEVINSEPHKFDEIGWFKLNKLPEPMHSGVAYTMEKYKEYFLPYTS